MDYGDECKKLKYKIFRRKGRRKIFCVFDLWFWMECFKIFYIRYKILDFIIIKFLFFKIY